MSGAREHEFPSLRVVSEHSRGRVLYELVRRAAEGFVDAPHELRLVEGIDVLPQQIAEKDCRGPYFLAMPGDIGQYDS